MYSFDKPAFEHQVSAEQCCRSEAIQEEGLGPGPPGGLGSEGDTASSSSQEVSVKLRGSMQPFYSVHAVLEVV